MMEELKKRLLDLLGEEGFRTEESMAKHTTFRTGGPADLFLMPQNRTELKESIALLREYNVPYLVIGNGSNLLVGDGGIRGAVIQLYQRMQNISVEGTEMTLDCGALLSAAAAQAADASLEGLAFASGIPGTFGGAVVMNAGAYGGEVKDVLLSADVLTADLEVKTIPVEELDLSYRHSIVPEKGYIVLGGKLQLISDAGLKGKTIGGAQVSEKHAGFIVNIGGATTKDILDLIAFCQKTVQEQFGVTLETEVKIVGER